MNLCTVFIKNYAPVFFTYIQFLVTLRILNYYYICRYY